MKIVFVFLSLFIGTARSVQFLKINSSGTYATLSFGHDHIGLSLDSTEVSVDNSGNLKFSKIGSSAHSICRQSWKIYLLTRLAAH